MQVFHLFSPPVDDRVWQCSACFLGVFLLQFLLPLTRNEKRCCHVALAAVLAQWAYLQVPCYFTQYWVVSTLLMIPLTFREAVDVLSEGHSEFWIALGVLFGAVTPFPPIVLAIFYYLRLLSRWCRRLLPLRIISGVIALGILASVGSWITLVGAVAWGKAWLAEAVALGALSYFCGVLTLPSLHSP